MKIGQILLITLLAAPAFAQAAQSWSLDGSTLSYHMSHPLHEVDGVSHAARGKGSCGGNRCDFLLAVPVKTFDSGDTNRDLHMLQVTRGAEFPIVTVRFQLPEDALDSPTIACDLEVQFAGNTAHYLQVPFHQVIEGNAHHITGIVPSTLSDFRIDPPSFLTVPIKNDIPVRVDMVWHRQ